MANKCFFCDSKVINSADVLGDATIVNCPSCGKYTCTSSATSPGNGLYPEKEKVASFLFYNKMNGKKDAGYFLGTKEEYEYQGNDRLRFITKDDIENWYPKSFSEKLDLMLLYFADQSDVYGDVVRIPFEAACSCMFVAGKGKDGSELSTSKRIEQIDFITKYFADDKLVVGRELGDRNSFVTKLTYKGWQRVDELQKDRISPMQKNAFIAMSFDSKMDPVKEAIKTAIRNCGYIPRIMNEIEHNHQIVPEMLHEIRQARFVVAELTGHNNGAYFEAGYALGLGKEVIQVCKKDQFGTDGHFDVKQVNTVLWEDVDKLAEQLKNRIKATIS